MAYNPHFSHSPRPTGNTPLRSSDALKRKRIDDYQAKDNPYLYWNKADLINYAISLETRLASCSGTTQARSRDNISGGIIDSGWTSGGNSSQSRGGASYAPPIPPPLPPLPPPVSDPDYRFINPLPPQDPSQYDPQSKKPPKVVEANMPTSLSVVDNPQKTWCIKGYVVKYTKTKKLWRSPKGVQEELTEHSFVIRITAILENVGGKWIEPPTFPGKDSFSFSYYENSLDPSENDSPKILEDAYNYWRKQADEDSMASAPLPHLTGNSIIDYWPNKQTNSIFKARDLTMVGIGEYGFSPEIIITLFDKMTHIGTSGTKFTLPGSPPSPTFKWYDLTSVPYRVPPDQLKFKANWVGGPRKGSGFYPK